MQALHADWDSQNIYPCLRSCWAFNDRTSTHFQIELVVFYDYEHIFEEAITSYGYSEKNDIGCS